MRLMTRSNAGMALFCSFLLIAGYGGQCGSIPDTDNDGTDGSADGTGTGGDVLTGSDDNADTVSDAVNTIEEMLGDGDDAVTIRSALVSQLQADTRVAGAGEDPSGDAVWVVFEDGEEHCFLIIDETSDTAGSLQNGSAAALRVSGPTPPGGVTAKQVPAYQFAGGGFSMPASNRALLVNSLSFIHSNWSIADSTNVIQTMLQARGYDVDRRALTVEDFDHLSSYGIIMIEAHGLWRDPEYAIGTVNVPSHIAETRNSGNCGGDAIRFSLLTTTPVDPTNLLAYQKDLYCGRVTIWNVSLLQADGSIDTQQFFGVTANYIRQHDSGAFPNNTILILNACKGYQDDLTAPFRDVLFEKCDGAPYFLGWTNKVMYAKGARAAMYLFQFMTVSNEEVVIDGVTVLEAPAPPRGHGYVDLNSSLFGLNERLYGTDTASGATLLQWGKNAASTLILAPYPMGLFMSDPDTFHLSLITTEQPTVTVGERNITASYNGQDLQIYPSAADYGDIVLSVDGRTSVPRVYHRWQPEVNVNGNVGAMQYNVTFRLQARATVDSSSFRSSPWDNAPPAVFEALWDPEGSNISWQVSGQDSSGGKTYQYTGSGLRPLGSKDGGSLKSGTSGTTARLYVYGDIDWTVTETDGPNTTTYQNSMTVQFTRDNVGLSPDWTVAADSFTEGGFGSSETVSWGAFAAEPPFNPNAEPR